MTNRYMGQVMAECDCTHPACEQRGYCMADRIEALEAKVADLRGKLGEAVEVLTYYSDPSLDGYDIAITDYGLSVETGCVIKDGGNMASAALAAVKEQGYD